jgi:RNA polymerase sigma-70 factor (ECF subfamily)
MSNISPSPNLTEELYEVAVSEGLSNDSGTPTPSPDMTELSIKECLIAYSTSNGINNPSLTVHAYDIESTETELLLSYIANGDHSAFWAIWNQHRKYLFALCLRQMGGVKFDAEDALSRAMLKAQDKLPLHAEGITDVRAWLGRLISNLCVDIHRERYRMAKGTVSLEEISASDNESMPSNAKSPEEVLLANEMRNYIRRAIEDLPPRLRVPYLLRSLKRTPYREIAAQLHLSSDNARKRVQQARFILRDRIDAYLRGFEEKKELHATLSGRLCESNSTGQSDLADCFDFWD